MSALAAPPAMSCLDRYSREQLAAGMCSVTGGGECHWPADVRFDDDINLLTLQLDTVGQLAAWANHISARRDRPIAGGTRLIHGAHGNWHGWNVSLWTYTALPAAEVDLLIHEVSL